MKKLNEILEQLRNLDPNDPGRWPLAARIGTVVLLFVLAASAGYWYFVWKAKRPELLEARAKETELWSTLETKARKAANLQAYKDQLAEMEKSFGAMLRQLPNKKEVADLLIDVSQTGLAAGLEFQLFQPQNEIPKDFYAELPIKLRVVGDYHEFGEFISGIAALPRIVTIHDIDIKPIAGQRAGGLVMEATAATYRYLDEGGALADAGAAPGAKKPAEAKKAAGGKKK